MISYERCVDCGIAVGSQLLLDSHHCLCKGFNRVISTLTIDCLGDFSAFLCHSEAEYAVNPGAVVFSIVREALPHLSDNVAFRVNRLAVLHKLIQHLDILFGVAAEILLDSIQTESACTLFQPEVSYLLKLTAHRRIIKIQLRHLL